MSASFRKPSISSMPPPPPSRPSPIPLESQVRSSRPPREGPITTESQALAKPELPAPVSENLRRSIMAVEDGKVVSITGNEREVWGDFVARYDIRYVIAGLMYLGLPQEIADQALANPDKFVAKYSKFLENHGLAIHRDVSDGQETDRHTYIVYRPIKPSH